MASIEKEIRQKKFSSSKEKAIVNVLYTAAWLNGQHADIMKSFGLSTQQFNVLRILRGQKGKPATIKSITERMIDKMSNASRIVDKLLAKGYVTRIPCKADKRRVDILITKEGLNLLSIVSDAVDLFTVEQDKLSEEESEQLSSLLDKLRN